jgi:hypothetical protein
MISVGKPPHSSPLIYRHLNGGAKVKIHLFQGKEVARRQSVVGGDSRIGIWLKKVDSQLPGIEF